jgi:hypothetical protein
MFGKIQELPPLLLSSLFSPLFERLRDGSVLAVVFAVFGLACTSGNEASQEGGPPAADAAPIFDLCDAFTEVGATCPMASPVTCFQECEAGGCFCDETSSGPRWTCVTDRSCLPACAPIDDACAPDAPE